MSLEDKWYTEDAKSFTSGSSNLAKPGIHLVKLAEVWRKSQQLTFRKSSGSRSTACEVEKKHLPIEAVHLDGVNYKSEVQIPPCCGRNTIKECSRMNLLRVFSQTTGLDAAPTWVAANMTCFKCNAHLNQDFSIAVFFKLNRYTAGVWRGGWGSPISPPLQRNSDTQSS